jgi:iron complex outermembrane recepter protein
MTRRLAGLRLLAILGAFWSTAAWAQTSPPPADTTVVQEKEVLVRGTRPVATVGGAGAINAKIDSLPVPADPTMEKVLRAMPAVYVRTNSRGEAEVTVRGSESRQVAILLDGIPLTYAWDGRADVSVIPALAPQDITLVRGLNTLMHGANSIGGVVEFNTRHTDPRATRRGVQARGDIDQDGGFGVAGAITAPKDLGWGVFTARAGVGHRDTPGQPLARGITEPIPTDDDLRLNTDVEETNGFASLRVDGDNGSYLSFAGGGYQAERGIAAQLGVTSARFWRYPFMARGIGVLSGGTGSHSMPWGGNGYLKVSAGYDKGRTEIDAYDSRDYTTITAEEDGNDEILTVRAVASQSIGGADFRLGATYGDIRHDEILSGVQNDYRQTLTSIAGQSEIGIPAGGAVSRYDVTFGATYDAASTPETGNKPAFADLDRWGGRVGLAAHLGTGGSTIHASLSQRARFPSLRELYSGALGSFEINPNLKPEELLAAEGGWTSRAPWGSLQVVGFYHMLSDAVVRIRPPGQNFQRVNQEGIRSVGGELLASRAFGRLQLSGDVIVQDVEVLDPSAGLTRPENMPKVLGAVRAQYLLGAGLLMAAEAEYTGEQFVIDPETDAETELAAAGRLNVEFRRAWAMGGGTGWFRGFEARAMFENLTDAPQYDAFGLPLPGRSMRLEFRLQ